MDPTTTAWQNYAATGRPDFLNYLHRGDVTWGDLWRYYRDTPTEPESIQRLTRLFHIFNSQDYDREGCVLSEDGVVYPRLREWAEFAVGYPTLLPEPVTRENLADLLSSSLISSLYYEAVFGVYLQAVLRRHADAWATGQFYAEERGAQAATGERKLSLNLPELPRSPDPVHPETWDRTVRSVMQRHYREWNQAFAMAIGDEDPAWQDEGAGG